MADLRGMSNLPETKTTSNIFIRFRPVHRLLIAFTLVLITYVLVRKIIYDPLVMTMVLWDVFCLGILISAWIFFFTCPPAMIRQIASKEDGSRLFVFFVVVCCSLASMVIVSLLLFSKTSSPEKALYLVVTVGGMLLSWVMVHTTFTFHYAYMYYGDDDETPEVHAEGLSFPEEKSPDYLDFAYFAFIIGMTFQVSDVVITSREIRRTALAHSLLAFALNTFVIALTVNLIAGLK